MGKDIFRNTLFELLWKWKDDHLHGILFINNVDQEYFVSYAELVTKAKKYLAYFQAMGVQPKDEVIIQTEDNELLLLAFWACILGGVIPVPLSSERKKNTSDKLFKIWGNLNNPFLFSDESHFQRNILSQEEEQELVSTIKAKYISPTLGEGQYSLPELHEPAINDLAFIQYSSGSTGTPKGVMLTHKNLAYNVNDCVVGAEMTRYSRSLSWIPLTHDLGMIAFHISHVAVGANQYIMPTSLFIRRPLLWLEKASEYAATTLYSPNFGIKYYLNALGDRSLPGINLSSVKAIINGAEPISIKVCQEFVERLAATGLPLNCIQPSYGMAEASVGISSGEVNGELKEHFLQRSCLHIGHQVKYASKNTPEEGVGFVNLGKCFFHTKMRVVDDRDNVLPLNTVGHIQIKGPNVTQGYYNNPEATAKVFTPDHWLRTGDVGFLAPDESVVITGRFKNIIILQGQNYFAHDIERVLFGIDDIDLGKVAVCGLAGGGDTNEKLLVYVVYRKPLEEFIPIIDEINERLLAVLGVAADVILPIKALPKTTSGKVQYFHLKQAFKGGYYEELQKEIDTHYAEYRAHKKQAFSAEEIQEGLQNHWAYLLNQESIGLHDNFFALGGHSLKVNQLIFHVRKTYGYQLQPAEVFNHPTIAQLADLMTNKEQADYTPIPQVEEQISYPASNAQQRLWLLTKVEQDLTAYNTFACFTLKGDLEIARLQAAIRALVARHEILRTTFTEKEGALHQVVHPVEKNLTDLEVIDWSNIEHHEDDLRMAITAQSQQVMDLEKGPLLKCLLYQHADQQYQLFFLMHHIICDGWSTGLFLRELQAHYNGVKENGFAAPLSIQYKDYTAWQQQQLESAAMAEHREFWLNHLSGELPVLDFPSDFPRPLLQSFRGRQLTHTFAAADLEKFQALCQQNGATLFMGLFTALNILLHRYTAQEDIMIGSPISGREHPDLDHQIGCYINLLALRTEFSAENSFQELLQQVRDDVIAAFAHQALPFDVLVEELQLKRDVSRNPLFDILLVLQDEASAPKLSLTGLESSTFSLEKNTAQFDISFEFRVTDGQLQLVLDYNCDLYTKRRMEAMIEHFARIIQQVNQAADQPIHQLNYLSEAERNQLLLHFNPPAQHFDQSKTILDVFNAQVEAQPQQVILQNGDRNYTYTEVQEVSNQLAAYLKAQYDIRPDDLVALQLERSEWMYFSILAILKAGGAYLPIDPGFPAERIEYILEDSQCKAVIDATTIAQFEEQRAQYPTTTVATPVAPHHLAYVLYTSGSTGKPKGVMIEHRSVVNFIQTIEPDFRLQAGMRMAATTNYTFDISVLEILGTLLQGIKSVLTSSEPIDLLQAIENKEFDILQCTPSKILQLIEITGDGLQPLQNLQVLILGGEAFSTNLYELLKQQLPQTITINGYGPTECTIYSSSLVLPESQNLSIGTPQQNDRIYILDQRGNLCPIGVKGEICVAGDSLARGYLHRPELTARKFVDNPFQPNTKMYRTGDVGAWLSDGNIQFLGRLDHQVKIRGYRVELGEIENVLLKIEGVNAVTVIAAGEEPGRQFLVAYLVTEQPLEKSFLRITAAQHLPDYMVPAYFVELPQMPLNASGKVDRKRLPKIAEEDVIKSAYAPARNELDKTLVAIWQEVLQLERIGIHDNFFELGGDSLKATRIASKVNAVSSTTLATRDVFIYPTIATQSDFLQEQQTALWAAENQLLDAIPLTPFQMKCAHAIEQGHQPAREGIVLGSTQALDQKTLEVSLAELVQRHTILQRNFEVLGEQLHFSNLDDSSTYTFSRKDWSTTKNAAKQLKGEVAAMLHEERAGLQAVHFVLPEEEVLFLSAPALLIDADSWNILLQDFHTIYQNNCEQEQSVFPQKPNDFHHWNIQWNDFYQTENQEQENACWTNWDAAAHQATTPVEPNGLESASEAHQEMVPAEFGRLLQSTANQAFNTKITDLLLAGLSLARHHSFNSNALCLEWTRSGRKLHADTFDFAQSIGCFSYAFPLCLPVPETEDLSVIIKNTKEQVRKIPQSGIGYQYHPVAQSDHPASIRLAVQLQPGLQEAIKESAFDWYQHAHHYAELMPHLRYPIHLEWHFAADQALHIRVTYDTQYFKAETIAAWMKQYRTSLQDLVQHCMQKEEIEFTPSDYDYKDLSIDDLEELETLFN